MIGGCKDMNALLIISVVAFICMILLIVTSGGNTVRFKMSPQQPPPTKQVHKVIAVDFDGTLVESQFPDIGAIKQEVVNQVREEKTKGNIIIIWTCRTGKVLEEAVQFLKNNDIPFDYVNENPLNPYGDTTRKVFADEYWDDKAIRIQ